VDQAAVALMDVEVALVQLTKEIAAGRTQTTTMIPTVAAAAVVRLPQEPLAEIVALVLVALDQTSTLLGHLQPARAIQDFLQAVAVVGVVNQAHRARVEMAVEETQIMVLDQQILGVVEQEMIAVQVVLVALA